MKSVFCIRVFANDKPQEQSGRATDTEHQIAQWLVHKLKYTLKKMWKRQRHGSLWRNKPHCARFHNAASGILHATQCNSRAAFRQFIRYRRLTAEASFSQSHTHCAPSCNSEVAARARPFDCVLTLQPASCLQPLRVGGLLLYQKDFTVKSPN